MSVSHIWNVHEFDLTARRGSTHMTRREVLLGRLLDDARGLSHAVALKDGSAEAYAEKLHDLGADRS